MEFCKTKMENKHTKSRRQNMSVETFEIQDILTVTDSAAQHFRKQVESHGVSAIRISLKESGCTGYKYVIDEVDAPQKEDIEITLKNGTNVYVDAQHLAGIRGTVIDYVKEGLNRNLVLNNPNVKNECGCGESFNF